MNKEAQRDYLAALEAAEDDSLLNADETETPQDDENPAQSEAEQLALDADAPKIVKNKFRQLTPNQLAFVRAKVAGKTNSEAYREAYPNDTSNDRVIASAAYRLTRHPMVSKMLEEAFEETVENLTEDVAATKRYVLRQLLTLTRTAKQEGSRLKALELMGKAVGVFTQQTETAAPVATAAELKAQLSGHLKLLKGNA